MARQQFLTVAVGEFTVFRPFTAPGLFAQRHMQSIGLLTFPDFSGGDLDSEQRKVALTQMVNIHRPLTALVLFLSVVALEDFIRDLGTRLADVPDISSHFPCIELLRPALKKNPAPYARPDRDPAPLSDWPQVNALYERVLNTTPIQVEDLPMLHDLALIRHTVAHHAAVTRALDVPRFQYWDVPANALLNPPEDFVRNIAFDVYKIGSRFDVKIREAVFSKILDSLAPNWHLSPPPIIVTLIELFNWFGRFSEGHRPMPTPGTNTYEQDRRAHDKAARDELVAICVEELRAQHAV